MIYRVQGLDGGGNFVSLQLDAGNSSEAAAVGESRGLEVLEVSEAGLSLFTRAPKSGGNKFPLLLFNQELLTLLQAGLTIVEGLETLLEKEARPQNREVLEAVVSSLHEGKTLSAALASQRACFPELYISTIRSSERSGNVVESIKRYVAYQQQVDLVRKKVITASIYPVLLLLVGGLVVLFLLVYVIPKFTHIYADTGEGISSASWLLVQWGTLIENHGGLLLAIVVGVVLVAGFLLSRESVRARLGNMLWRLPVIGERMRIYQLARFYRTLGMLMCAGIPIMVALERVAGLLDRRLQIRLIEAGNLVREGQSLSVALERHELSTAVAMRMLRVGERSGQLGLMMEKIADFHEEELNRWIDWASRLFEPLLMTFIGAVIGTIVVLMYIPIFELAGSIQ